MKYLLMYRPSLEHARALRAAAPSCTLEVATTEADAAARIADAEVVLGNRWFVQSLPNARRLRWMQSNSAGVDLVLSAGAALDRVVVTCARGVYDNEVSEHAVAMLLALVRGLHRARDQQQRREWTPLPLASVHGSRSLVLGWGAIGQCIGRRLTGLGASVTGVRRTHSGPPGVDASGCLVHGPETWRQVLPETDVLVLALPKTAATRHFVGARELAALPQHAHLINVGRGGTLDDDALLAALADGRLAGAGLDVLEHEPPPPDHAAWREPRLLLSPHMARSRETPPFAWEPLFVENVRRYAAREPLLNVVDRAAGY